MTTPPNFPKTPAPDADPVAGLLRDILASTAELHTKFDKLTARADEAEKLLSSPAVKAFTKAKQVWKGL